MESSELALPGDVLLDAGNVAATRQSQALCEISCSGIAEVHAGSFAAQSEELPFEEGYQLRGRRCLCDGGR